VDSNAQLGFDTVEKMLQELEDNVLLVYTMVMAACNTCNLFNTSDLDKGGQHTINHNEGDTDILSQMYEVPSLFKTLTDFEIGKFDLLASLDHPELAYF
jgi:hypothetical protein